jgi:hypothetical protein
MSSKNKETVDYFSREVLHLISLCPPSINLRLIR